MPATSRHLDGSQHDLETYLISTDFYCLPRLGTQAALQPEIRKPPFAGAPLHTKSHLAQDILKNRRICARMI